MKSFPERLLELTGVVCLTEKTRFSAIKAKKMVFWGIMLVSCMFVFVFCCAYWASAANEIAGKENVLSSMGESGKFVYSALDADIEKPSRIEPYDYVLWRKENLYFAMTGATGEIAFAGGNLSQIVESIVSQSSNGVFLFFKSGVYHLSSPISILEKNDVRIMGAGRELTKFTVSNGITAFNVIGNPESHNLRFEISDCTIDGGAVSSTKYGIYMKYVDSAKLHDMEVTCFDTHVYVEDCQKPSVYNFAVWSNSPFSYGFHFVGYNIDVKMKSQFCIPTLTLWESDSKTMTQSNSREYTLTPLCQPEETATVSCS